MTTHPPLREALACSVLDAVQATRAMGRVMLSAAVEGAIVRYIVVQDTASVHTLPPLERTVSDLPRQKN